MAELDGVDHDAAAVGVGQVFPVLSLNHEGLKPRDCGLWSEIDLPPELKGHLRDPQRYLQAMERINTVHQKKVWFRSESRLKWFLGFMAALGTVGAACLIFQNLSDAMTIISTLSALVGLYAGIFTYENQLAKRIVRVLQSVVGGANALLWEEDVLIGCESNAELLVVRVPLSGCVEHLGPRFEPALKKYSCAYVCGLAQRPPEEPGHLRSAPPPEEPGHLRGAPCFCQFVLAKSCCYCCCCYC